MITVMPFAGGRSIVDAESLWIIRSNGTVEEIERDQFDYTVLEGEPVAIVLPNHTLNEGDRVKLVGHMERDL